MRKISSLMLLFYLIFLLPLYGKAQEIIKITLEEGDFIIKNLSVTKDKFGSQRLKGQIINNTSKDWAEVTFQVYLFDSSGNKIGTGLFEDEVTISGIKRGEEKPIGVLGEGEFLLGLKGITVTRYEVSFKKGMYPAKYNFIMIKPVENKELSFEDDGIKILFSISKREIAFILQNKTNNPIRIDWNQISYVDYLGKSHRIMHSGVKYIDRDNSQAPTIVPPTARIEDIVFPTDYIYYSSGKYGGWREIPLFPEAPEAKLFKERDFSIFMPLEVNGIVKNFFFTFKIENIEL